MSGDGQQVKQQTGCYVDASIVIQGVLVGLILAVPVGPLSLMCIRRTLSEGRLHGILSGIGVTAADAVYALVAFLGLTAISGLIISHVLFLRAFAGLVLIAVGLRIIFFLPDGESEKTGQESYTRDFLSMLTLAIASPMTLLFLMVTLPGYGLVFGGTSLFAAGEFVAGFVLGSAAWWVILCGAVGSLRSRISPNMLVLINRISGLLIVCVGAVMISEPLLILAGLF